MRSRDMHNVMRILVRFQIYRDQIFVRRILFFKKIDGCVNNELLFLLDHILDVFHHFVLEFGFVCAREVAFQKEVDFICVYGHGDGIGDLATAPRFVIVPRKVFCDDLHRERSVEGLRGV